MRASGECPFCGAALGTLRVVPSASKRLARGAVFVFASSVAACGGSTESEDPTIKTDTGASSTDTGAKVDSALVDTSMGEDTGNVAPPYGIPPEDSGVTDGTVDDTGGGMAKYGAPPPPADAG